MKTDPAHGRRNREGDSNVIVERGFVIGLTQRAVKVVMQGPQAAKALHYIGAHRAEKQPIHLEKTHQRPVQEQIDRLVIGYSFVGSKPNRIDAEKCGIVGST